MKINWLLVAGIEIEILAWVTGVASITAGFPEAALTVTLALVVVFVLIALFAVVWAWDADITATALVAGAIAFGIDQAVAWICPSLPEAVWEWLSIGSWAMVAGYAVSALFGGIGGMLMGIGLAKWGAEKNVLA